MTIKYEYDPTPSVKEFEKMGENVGRALFGANPNPHSFATEKLRITTEDLVATPPTAEDFSRAAFLLIKEIGGNQTIIDCYAPGDQVELQDKLRGLNYSLGKVAEYLLEEARKHG